MRTGADVLWKTALFLCKPYVFILFGKNVREWSSEQNSISESVLQYKDYVLMAYSWYLASEIPVICHLSVKFVQVLQVASSKALPVYVKCSDLWVETQENVLCLDFYTCSWGQSLFCLWVQGSSPFQTKFSCSGRAAGHRPVPTCPTALVKANASVRCECGAAPWGDLWPGLPSMGSAQGRLWMLMMHAPNSRAISNRAVERLWQW